MIRLNDYQQCSVDQLRQKSRAYLSVGALAVTAAAAFLAISDVEAGLAYGSALALFLFAISAFRAVLAERRKSLPDAPDAPDAPDVNTLADLITGPTGPWTDDQLALWVARECVARIQPLAEAETIRIARLVDYQLILFFGEVVVVGAT